MRLRGVCLKSPRTVGLNHSIILAGAVAAVLAAFAVLVRSRGSLAGKLFAVGMLLFGVESIINLTALQQTALPDLIRWSELRFVPTAFLPVVWIAFSLSYSRSNHREHFARNRAWLWAAGLLPVVMLSVGGGNLFALVPDPEYAGRQIIEIGWSGQVLLAGVIGAAVLVMLNLERTFRASVGTQRWRLKLVLVGLGGLFVARIFGASQALLHGRFDEQLMVINAAALVLACLLVGVSVLRTGEFSIDLYPSQTALHRSLIVVAIGGYLLVVGVLARLTSWLGSAADFQFKALVLLVGLILLALLLMSDRLRERTRAWVNRHFNRPTYSYRTVWASYTQSVAGHESEAAAGQALAEWVSETMKAMTVSVWLLDEATDDLRLIGTSLESGQHPTLAGINDAGTRTVIVQSVAHLAEVVDLDDAEAEPVAELRRLHPQVFPNGGNRLAAPLSVGRRSLGVIIAGDRVSVVPFGSEDRELLATIGGQAGSLFNSLRLSQRLAESREMAAFQSMSTFFVHDLKNTASSLSLMLQNLPRHFDNPEFREDAFRSIRRSVERINQMIASLSALRGRLAVEAVLGDLASFGPRLQQLARDRGLQLVTELAPAGPVRLDDEQILRVLTNLLVNAHEAAGNRGLVTVRSGTRGQQAFISVSDEGPGMDTEFIARRLFRPFQTTKKQGTGIGLYHSKMIVDAHGGRLEVRSAPGAGTTFTLLLPLCAGQTTSLLPATDEAVSGAKSVEPVA